MRRQLKKSMKNRIKNLREGMRVSFLAGKQAVAEAAHGLSYDVYSPVPDTLGVVTPREEGWHE